MTAHPYVVLSCAMSLDDTEDQHLVLFNAEDRERAYILRAWADAVLIGAGTLRSNNPRLRVHSNCWRAERPALGRSACPARVVLPRSAGIDPQEAASFATEGTDRLVYCDHRGTVEARRRPGVPATTVDAGSTPELSYVLTDLKARGVHRLLVKGDGHAHNQPLTQASPTDSTSLPPHVHRQRRGALLRRHRTLPQRPWPTPAPDGNPGHRRLGPQPPPHRLPFPRR